MLLPVGEEVGNLLTWSFYSLLVIYDQNITLLRTQRVEKFFRLLFF